VKEAVFKVRNEVGISFKDHIFVNPFEMNQEKTTALLDFNQIKIDFNVYFTEIENLHLSLVMGKRILSKYVSGYPSSQT